MIPVIPASMNPGYTSPFLLETATTLIPGVCLIPPLIPVTNCVVVRVLELLETLELDPAPPGKAILCVPTRHSVGVRLDALRVRLELDSSGMRRVSTGAHGCIDPDPDRLWRNPWFGSSGRPSRNRGSAFRFVV